MHAHGAQRAIFVAGPAAQGLRLAVQVIGGCRCIDGDAGFTVEGRERRRRPLTLLLAMLALLKRRAVLLLSGNQFGERRKGSRSVGGYSLALEGSEGGAGRGLPQFRAVMRCGFHELTSQTQRHRPGMGRSLKTPHPSDGPRGSRFQRSCGLPGGHLQESGVHPRGSEGVSGRVEVVGFVGFPRIKPGQEHAACLKPRAHA